MSERKPTELAEFLTARRARLTPQDAGLDGQAPRRRVPGLRREELARLAGVSVDYYTRLEQGRSRSASTDVLDAFGRRPATQRRRTPAPAPAGQAATGATQTAVPAPVGGSGDAAAAGALRPGVITGLRARPAPRRARAQPAGGRADHRVS